MDQQTSGSPWKRIFLTSSCVILTFTSLHAQATGVITHQPVIRHTATEVLVIQADVSSPVDVERVDLFYRETGEEGFIEVEMEGTTEGWRGEIPLERLSLEGVEYFISATLVDGSVLNFPETDPQDAPVSVQISPEPEPTTVVEAAPAVGVDAVIIFSPLPGARIPFDDVLIAASLFNVDSVDVSSVRLLVDGRDVTARSLVGPDLVTYEPKLLLPGRHQVRIELTALTGRPVEPKAWSFEAVREHVEKVEAVERVLTYGGRINGGYSFDEIDEGDPLAISQTTANFSGEWGPLRFKSDLKLTSEEDSFKQPRNRYRLSLEAGDYLRLKFGDFNSRLSRFTLDGKRVRGVDADLQLGFVNLHVVKGELERKIQGRLGEGETYLSEGVELQGESIRYQLNRKGYTFQKDIFSTRLSFGSGKIFQLGFNWLKAKDDITSVEPILDNAKIEVDTVEALSLAISPDIYTYRDLSNLLLENNYSIDLADEESWAGDSPQDNIVMGSDLKFSLFRRQIGIEAGFAFSMFNGNIWGGAFSKSELDTLGVLGDSTLDGKIGGSFDIPFDPKDYEDLFVLNLNLRPLIPVDTLLLFQEPVKAILKLPSAAYNFRASGNLLQNRLSFEFVQVGPEFNSLGNPYIQKNNRQYTISDRVGFFQNRLLLNLIYKHQDDDILRVVTDVTTTNTVTMNAGIYPGGDLPSFALSYRVQDRDNGKTTLDTVNVDPEARRIDLEDLRNFTKSVNASFGLTHRVSFSGFNHNLSVNYVLLDRADQFDDRPSAPYFGTNLTGDTLFFDSTFVSPNLKSDVINLSVMTEYPFPLKTTAIVSVNRSTFGIPEDFAYDYGGQNITNVTLSGTYDVLGNRLKLLAGINRTSGTGNEEFSRLGIRAGVNYRITEYLRARFDGGLRFKKIDGESKRSTLIRASLNYTF
ncbi:MAG: hypothetical protein V3U24_09785 [Candidatus Neomarinimicrobiota bacterium]